MYTQSLMNLCNSILNDGRKRFPMSMGIVSHIENDQYKIAAVSSSANVFVKGESFSLKDTYCRDVYEQKATIAITEIEGVPGLQLHPLYDALSLEAYIGTPIIVDDKVWGTLNFSSMALRQEPFNKDDIEFIVKASKKIAQKITEGVVTIAP